ncbi:PDR/VanB family oxidoreductase [Mycolicibacterium sp. P9-22]|uniref:PDR/VanB family oxidoreductase n=1 Tax=Mycolicibacterium sp. P9-22 TaxID=2024613 RepID=UPI001D15B087|nr:PDR/VanB family oxidoreductase [Mycolicibacterium sp. P9-22]
MTAAEFDGELVVHERHTAADGVVALRLSAKDGRQLPPWDPGAHIDVVLTNGLVRQYSLCGDPGDGTSWRVGVLRDPNTRGGSALIHDEFVVGCTVRVRGPRNHFHLEPSKKYIFVAGGIGITPILPMLTAAENAGADWTLLYGGRSCRSMAFLDELSGYDDRVRVRPFDQYGLLDLKSVLSRPDSDTLVYCCGPEPLLDAVAAACSNWPDGSLRVERFSATTPPTPAVGDRPIHVHLRRSEVSVVVPEDCTILQAVTAAGADVLSSCEDGVCGTCMTTVLDGVPEHRDSVLSEGERRAGSCMLICVSRAQGDHLVLDL